MDMPLILDLSLGWLCVIADWLPGTCLTMPLRRKVDKGQSLYGHLINIIAGGGKGSSVRNKNGLILVRVRKLALLAAWQDRIYLSTLVRV